jgi:hypothetical protein
MRLRNTGIIFLIICTAVMTSCRRNQYKINTSGITVNIEIRRLEKDLFTADPAEIPSLIPLMKEKYGDFIQLFSSIIKAGDINDSSFGDLLTGFCTDKLNNEVYSSVIQKFPDIREIEQDLNEAFRHCLRYFPDKKVPAVFTCITGFNYSIITVTGEPVLGIGLDRYLGRESEYYPRLGIYKYLSDRMNSWNIVPDCMYAWGSRDWDFESMRYPDDNVLTEMIHYGKLKYFEKCMLPEVNDTIIFGFTADQMKFCRNNEDQMWEYLIENDILFKTDQFTIRKLTGEAPFTSYFTSESPGRASVWVGFRIVESYMMKNRGTSLGELMADKDVKGILAKAKYRPK